MKPIRPNVIEKLDNTLITDEQQRLIQKIEPVNDEELQNWKKNELYHTEMMAEIDSLKIVLQQIKNTEMCPISCITRNK